MSSDSLPHSEALEGALVARLLVDPAQLPVIAGQLSPEDFYVGTWRRAYASMQKMSADRRTVDIEGLREAIGDEEAAEIGRRLGEITAAHRAPLDEYAVMLRDFAFRRRMITTLESFVTKARQRGDREVLLGDFHEAVQQISASVEAGSLLSPSQAVEVYVKSMEQRASGERSGLSWGMKLLDDMMYPARGGEMIILAARPSIGKTVLAEQIADHWARLGPHPVLFASLEMPIDSLMDRTVSRLSGLQGSDVIRSILTEAQIEKVRSTLEDRRGVGLWYLDDSYASTAALRAAAARIRLLSGGLTAIVVDYLQLLRDHHESEVTRVTRISRNLKALAREFNVPVLVLSQLNRASESREDGHPRLNDLRDSGALEQDADRVLGLWRPDRASELADLDVLKARQGPTGRIYLNYDGEHFRFTDSPPDDQSPADDDFGHFS